MFKAKVAECVKREFEGRVYYVLLVSGDGVPFGKVSSSKPFNVGDICTLIIARKESNMQLVVRVQ